MRRNPLRFTWLGLISNLRARPDEWDVSPGAELGAPGAGDEKESGAAFDPG
jgi:hypothetical protein